MSERRLTERRSPPTEAMVVMPTYNERENLERVVSGVRHLGHDVLIVDDASPDGTGELADDLAAADPAVRVLHRERKLGLGSAYVDAFRIGLKEGSPPAVRSVSVVRRMLSVLSERDRGLDLDGHGPDLNSVPE